MLNKYYIAFSGILLCLMAVVAYGASISGPDNLLIIGTDEYPLLIDNRFAEQIREEAFLSTYKSVDSASVSSGIAVEAAVVYSVNELYPHLWQYQIISGSFFTRQHMDNKERVAVLNEKAARELFGGHDLSGAVLDYQDNKYIITGVLDDKNDDDCTIYIPFTLGENRAPVLAALVDRENGVTEDFILSRLEALGIQNAKHNRYTGHYLLLAYRLFCVCLYITVFGACLLAALSLFGRMKKSGAAFLNEIHKDYWQQIIKDNQRAVIKFLGNILLFLFSIALIYKIAGRLLSLCLAYGGIAGELFQNGFGAGMPEIGMPLQLSLYVCLLMAAYLTITGAVFLKSVLSICKK